MNVTLKLHRYKKLTIAQVYSVPMENPPDCALLKEAGHHAASASEEEAPQQKLIVCTYV